MEGEGVKNPENLADVIFERPLRTYFVWLSRDPDSVLLYLRATVLPPNERPGAVQLALLLLQLLRQTEADK